MSEHPRLYVASPLGFFDAGRYWNTAVLLPRLYAEGFDVIDPWRDQGPLDEAVRMEPGPRRQAALATANHEVGARNAVDIRSADAVLGVLEGADVDSGTAAEIGFAAALGRPVVAFRTDLRNAGEEEAVVNLQVEYFVDSTGGWVTDSLDDAIEALRQIL